MLYPDLIRPLLFRFDPERAHDLVLLGTRWFARAPLLCHLVRAMARPKPTPVCALGLSFPNPVGLAGGMDKNAVAPFAWWAFGFGFVELGTVTPLPQPGNDKPRMFRQPEARALVNRMGFNNDGAGAVAERLAGQARRGLRPPFPIGVSVGKNKATPVERTADDYAAAAATLAPHADFVSVNVSSPNTPGLRGLQTPAWLSKLVTVVRAASGAKPVLVKVAPELDGDDLDAALDAVMAAGAAGVIATNTLGCVAPTGEPAGRSGRPLRDISPRRVEAIRRRVGDAATVIGCGGVDDAGSAQRMLDAGATLIQLYTGLVFEGPFLPAAITRGLRRGRPRREVSECYRASAAGSPTPPASGGVPISAA
jgi:dihydroorotate dehydrogenase